MKTSALASKVSLGAGLLGLTAIIGFGAASAATTNGNISGTGYGSNNTINTSITNKTKITNTNDISISSSNGQSSSTGSANSSDNTSGGSSTSGNASNSNTNNVSIIVSNF